MSRQFGAIESLFGGMRDNATKLLRYAILFMYRAESHGLPGQGGTGKFMSQKFVSSTKIGADGRPVNESYQTNTHGVYGGRKKPEILERKQAYQNSGTGYQKAAHERMYQGKGRKVIYEKDRNSGSQNSHNIYRGVSEDEAQIFDREWEQAANQYGLNSGMESLPYGSGTAKNYHRSSSYDHGGYDDNHRRGHYISDRSKGQNRPVRISKPSNHAERLMPTDTGNRMQIPNNRDQGANQAFALPSNENRAEANRNAARVGNQGRVNQPARGGKNRARIC